MLMQTRSVKANFVCFSHSKQASMLQPLFLAYSTPFFPNNNCNNSNNEWQYVELKILGTLLNKSNLKEQVTSFFRSLLNWPPRDSETNFL